MFVSRGPSEQGLIQPCPGSEPKETELHPRDHTMQVHVPFASYLTLQRIWLNEAFGLMQPLMTALVVIAANSFVHAIRLMIHLIGGIDTIRPQPLG